MDMIKVALVALLALALPVHAADSILDNPAEVETMCQMYAKTAGIVTDMHNRGMDYAALRAKVEAAQAQGQRESTMTARDKAFVAQYVTSAVDFSFTYPDGATRSQVQADALVHCRTQFGRG